jgi:hypothetical protein
VRNDALHNHKGGLEGRHTRRNDYGGCVFYIIRQGFGMSRFSGPCGLTDSGFRKVFRLNRFSIFVACCMGVFTKCGDTGDLRNSVK